jgi:DUF177 domain-containing protein
MFLSVKEMEVRRIHFAESFEPGRIDFSESQLRQIGPLETEGTATLLANTGGEIRIQGTFGAMMEADCDRCLTPARFPVEQRLDLFYRSVETGPEEDEVALDEGEAEIGFYEGLGIELADIIKEQVLLALPMQRICREDCKGICPVCGGNRNETSCDCAARAGDDRWGALKDLSKNLQSRN